MYMKMNYFNSKTRRGGAVAYAVLTLGLAGSSALAQAPANVSPDLQQIVKLAQAQMSDDVIVSFIKNAGKSYRLWRFPPLRRPPSRLRQPRDLRTRSPGQRSSTAGFGRRNRIC